MGGGFVDPQARMLFQGTSLHPVLPGQGPHGFDQRGDIGSNVLLWSRQRHDGIGYQLAGAVIGDVAAPIGTHQGDPHSLEQVGVDQHVPFVGPTSQGDDGLVFEEEKHVGRLSADTCFLQMLLKAKDGLVGASSQVENEQGQGRR
jgi:hypothetical protein